MIRCNNCMCIFESDDELVKYPIVEDGVVVETIDACPDCLTDAYLMNLEKDEEK